jgi:S-adenosylmethionine hydrolase
MSIITLATDFGTADGYVGEMKGVIKTISPSAEIVDITHELKSINKAYLVIKRYCQRFPAGTVHLVVVDPTVGSTRKALIGYNGDHYFVGPDNGLFSLINLGSKWWGIDSDKIKSKSASSTFHGRDIFAPAAAMLSKGQNPGTMGDKIDNIVTIDFPKIQIIEDFIMGAVIDIDNFGNLITNIKLENISGFTNISVGEQTNIPFVKTYSDVELNQPLAYIGSGNYLEIGVNGGRAELYFKAVIGTEVYLKK